MLLMRLLFAVGLTMVPIEKNESVDLHITGTVVQSGYVYLEIEGSEIRYAEGVTGPDGWYRSGTIPLEDVDEVRFAFLHVGKPAPIYIARADHAGTL